MHSQESKEALNNGRFKLDCYSQEEVGDGEAMDRS